MENSSNLPWRRNRKWLQESELSFQSFNNYECCTKPSTDDSWAQFKCEIHLMMTKKKINHAPSLQPSDQGVVATFKAYCLSRTFLMPVNAAHQECAGRNIMQNCIDNLVEAWKVYANNGCIVLERKVPRSWFWRFPTFKAENTASCVQLAKQVGFEEVEYEVSKTV